MDEVGWNAKKNLRLFDAGEVDQGIDGEGSELSPLSLFQEFQKLQGIGR